jgi:hypothetical protein
MDDLRTPDDDTTDSDERKDAPQPHDEPDRLPDGNYVGEDNIREGRVGGVIGGPHQQGGEGGGG